MHGIHLVMDFLGCTQERIRFVDTLEPLIISAVEASRARIVSSSFHQFKPVGASGVILLAESHFAFHTWPEDGLVTADLFTCGESLTPHATLEILREGLEAKEVKVQEIKRGRPT